MHLKLTKHGEVCKQNNELPTKSHDELKDNSIVYLNHIKKSSRKRKQIGTKRAE